MSQPGHAALDWLTDRDADSPPDLRRRVRSVVVATPAAPTIAATLVDAAMTCLAAALRLGSERAAAAELLAADALLTYACEATAAAHADAAFDLLLGSVVERSQSLLAASP